MSSWRETIRNDCATFYTASPTLEKPKSCWDLQIYFTPTNTFRTTAISMKRWPRMIIGHKLVYLTTLQKRKSLVLVRKVLPKCSWKAVASLGKRNSRQCKNCSLIPIVSCPSIISQDALNQLHHMVKPKNREMQECHLLWEALTMKLKIPTIAQQIIFHTMHHSWLCGFKKF